MQCLPADCTKRAAPRRAYIAVDAVVGFLASNGIAPFPAGKAKTVLATTEQALEFLSKGK